MRELADWRKSHRSIRRRLRGVVLIPSITLLVMWAAVSSFSLYDGLYTRSVASGVQDVSIPAVGMLSSVQKERGMSMVALSQPRSDRQALDQQRQATDRSAAAMHAAADPMLDQSPGEVRQRMAELNAVLGQLSEIRQRVDAGHTDQGQVYDFYNRFVDSGSSLFEVQARNVPDYEAGQTALNGVELFRYADRQSRSGALVADAISSGELSSTNHAELARLIGSYRLGLSETADSALPRVSQHYRAIASNPEFTRLGAWEEQVINAGGGKSVRIDGRAWTETSNQVGDSLNSLAVQQVTGASQTALDYGNENLLRVVVGSLVALAATVAAVVITARVSRRIVSRLTDLREATLEVSGDQLPSVVDRLRRGDHVEIDTAVPSLDYGSDEIGQVADAFNIAQHTAVSAAIQESQARDGVNTVFLGIAHRSQALVHRQLRVLDKLERSGEDPEQMELMFQLDHLATRSRRNAENLIILGGKQPGRRWNKPIKLVDVLRSAIAETKHYARVRLHHPPELSIIGNAVADTIHLVAELVDNATSFSPPNSRVTVGSQLVARGLVVEIEDRGLGIEDAELAAANEVLRNPPEFNAMGLQADARLGLFVVARLAARHGIDIELRSSPYGGTRAVVLLPTQLTAAQEDPRKDDPHTGRIPRVRAESEPGLADPDAEQRSTGSLAPSDPADSRPSGRHARSALNDTGTAEVGRYASTDTGASSGDAASPGNSGSIAISGDTGVSGDTDDNEVGEHEWPPEWPDTPDWPTDGSGNGRLGAQPDWTDPAQAPASGDGFSSRQHSPKNPRGRENTSQVQNEPSEHDWPSADAHPRQQSSRPPLPRRRRQANLAPQLAQEPAAPSDVESEPTRTPEQIRGVMSAFQQGTYRGREERGPDPDATEGEHDE